MVKFHSLLWIVYFVALPTLASSQSTIVRPEEIVHGAATRLIETFTENSEKVSQNPAYVIQVVYDTLFPIVDTKRMARIALGKHWKSATQKQRERFVDGFEKLLLKTYSTAFSAFNGQRVTFSAARFNKKKSKALVHSDIFRQSGPPISVDYKLYLTKKGEWKVYDAVVDGMAIVSSFQSLFYKQIDESGLDHTLKSLNTKVENVHFKVQ